MHKRFFLFAATTAAALLATAAQSWACSVCFTGTGDAVTDGFNASVLFLMSTPYLVIGSIVGAVIVSYRRALKLRERTDSIEAQAPIAELAWQQEENSR